MNRSFIVILVASLLVAEAVLVGIVFWVVNDAKDPVVIPDRENALLHEVVLRDEEIQRLGERIASLEEERASFETRLEEAVKASVSTRVTDAAGAITAIPSEPGGSGASGRAGAKEEAPEKVTCASFASRLVKMAKLMKESSDKPTPELMKMVSEMMQDAAALQAEYGFEEPGLVTESPEFKAHALITALEDMGQPLSPSEKSSILLNAEQAMGSYIDAVHGKPGDFSLEKTAGILAATDAFDRQLGKAMEGRNFEGSLLGKMIEKETDGSGRNTSWPSHSCTGVKDLEGAEAAVTKRWARAMGIAEAEIPSLQAVARNFVDRSHAARLRYGSGEGGKLSTEDRKTLDQELACFQVDALKRIHGSLNLSNESKEKVLNYRSLDRFEIGMDGSWSKSGSFGNFVVSSGESSEETR